MSYAASLNLGRSQTGILGNGLNGKSCIFKMLKEKENSWLLEFIPVGHFQQFFLAGLNAWLFGIYAQITRTRVTFSLVNTAILIFK